MDAADLDYPLPPSAIAQTPCEPRDAARLLVATGGRVEHRTVADLDRLLEPGDLVVVNDTRVLPARIHLTKPTGGAVEVLLLAQRGPREWEALVRPSRRVADGTVLRSAVDDRVAVEVGAVLGADGRRRVVVHLPDDIGPDDLGWLDGVGEVPLPPYIHEPLAEPDRYQTVFARRPVSVAAPTAGLHLTDAVLDRCRARGVEILTVELAVGLGTFRPITEERVEDHPMHAERYRIPPATVDRLTPRLQRSEPGRLVAVGTTAVRALESWAATGETEGDTRLFIHGRYPWALVDRLLTNFHVPRSSLLALVEAFVGPVWRDLYAEALHEGYRFLSFGDTMVLDRRDRAEP